MQVKRKVKINQLENICASMNMNEWMKLAELGKGTQMAIQKRWSYYLIDHGKHQLKINTNIPFWSK